MRSGLARRIVLPFAVLVAAAFSGVPAVAAEANVAPSVVATVSNANPVEPQTVVASGTFTDPESAVETYTCSILYGDGTPGVAGVVSGLTCTGPAHQYKATGTYSIAVTVTDSGGASGVWLTSATYTNLAPWVGGLGLVGDHQVGRTAHAVTAIVDPGAAIESYSCSVDYGDGSPILAGTYVPTGWSDGEPRCVFPDHIYTAIGTYTLTAVVTDSGGASGSARFNETIVPEITPRITAPADQTVHSSQDGVHMGWHDFSLGSFVDPNGTAAGPWTCTVYWGDGGIDNLTVSAQGPLKMGHAYVPGTHQVRVVVTNHGGWWSDVYFNATVIDDGPTVVFPSSQIVTSEGDTTTVVTGFYDPAPDGPFAFHMDWGDGSSQDLTLGSIGPITIDHIYAASDPTIPGVPVTTYRGWATVVDAQGRSSSAPLDVAVQDKAPVITTSGTVLVPEGQGSWIPVATFTDSSVGPWYLDVSDGHGIDWFAEIDSPGPIEAPYDPAAGNGTITINLADRGGLISSASIQMTVVNVAPVVGPIYIDGDVANGQPLEGGSVAVDAAFDDPAGVYSTTESFACTVDYGDGSGPVVGEIQNGVCYGPAHKYGATGSGTITIAVSDSNGGTGSSSLNYTLVNVAPTVNAFMSNYNPDESPSGVTAWATIGDPGSGSETYTCTVDYGDGTVVAGVVVGGTCTGPAHQYRVTGNYSVTISVNDGHGGTGIGTTAASYLNRAPSVGGGLVGPFEAGATVKDVAWIDDPGATFETYTCTVQYGDGSPAKPGTYVPTGWSDGLPRCVGPDHVYAAAGSYSIVTTVTDSGGETGTNLVIETIGPARLAVGPVSVSSPVVEGSTVTASAVFAPTGHQTYKCTVDYGDGSGAQAGVVSGTTCKGPSHKFGRPGAFNVTVVVTGSTGIAGQAFKTVTVTNVAPTITKATIPSTAKLGSAVAVSATFTDPGTSETHQVDWTWGDGTTTTIHLGAGVRCVSASHLYSKAGAYQITLAISDGDIAYDNYVVAVYDPARTISGYGTFPSPQGACVRWTKCNVASTGSFVLNASYAKGATKPTVNFTFSVAGLNFAATGADWFAQAGGTAAIQGTGSANGAGGYKFLLGAVDGRPDMLTVSIFDPSGSVLYYASGMPVNTGGVTFK